MNETLGDTPARNPIPAQPAALLPLPKSRLNDLVLLTTVIDSINTHHKISSTALYIPYNWCYYDSIIGLLLITIKVNDVNFIELD